MPDFGTTGLVEKWLNKLNDDELFLQLSKKQTNMKKCGPIWEGVSLEKKLFQVQLENAYRISVCVCSFVHIHVIIITTVN